MSSRDVASVNHLTLSLDGVPNRLLGELVEAAVTLLAPEGAGPGPAAAAGAAAAATVSEQDLIAHCAASLASFKVPHRVFIVPAMPTTSTGKVQKRQLRDAAAAAAAAAANAAITAARHRAAPRGVAQQSDDRPGLIELIRGELENIAPGAACSDGGLADDAPLAEAGLQSNAAVELAGAHPRPLFGFT